MSLLNHFLRNTKKRLQFQTQKAFNLDNQLNWQRELSIIDFQKSLTSDEINNQFLIGSDADIGGKSNCSLVSNSGYTTFQGQLSSYMPNFMEIKIPGYAGFKLKTSEHGNFERTTEFFDTLRFRYLELKVREKWHLDQKKSRGFMVNIQTDSLIPSDLFQHRLFLNKPNQWETVLIPFNDFILTNDGNVEQEQLTMFREKVKSVGISISDRREGPFELDIMWIKAINTNYTDGDIDQIPFKEEY